MDIVRPFSDHADPAITRLDRRALLGLGGIAALTGGAALLATGTDRAGAVGRPLVRTSPRTSPVQPAAGGGATGSSGNNQQTGATIYGPTTLHRGMTGKYVDYLQTELSTTWHGEGKGPYGGPYGYYDGELDARFGASTEKAVKDFQRDLGLTVDGRVGPETKKWLVFHHGWEPKTSPGNLRDYGTKIMHLGSSGVATFHGQAVSNLQGALDYYNRALLGLDGAFGADVDAAVRVFQKRHGLTVDGRVGPATKKAIATTVPKGK
jgi:hypothetical protein